MPIPRLRPPARLRPRRRTARLRLTALYGAAFVVCGACGAAILAITYLLYGHLTGNLRACVRGRPAFHGIAAHLAHQAESKGFNFCDVSKDPVASGPGNMTIRVAGLGQVTLDRQDMLVASIIAAVVFVLAAAVIGWLLAGRVLRPLSTITAAARRISASSLHERLALHGPDDELKELADTLDGLFARLEASFDAQQRFAANASHELRTPLTRERTLLQVTLADPAATAATWQAVSRELLASNAEQERLIESLLTLASSETSPGEHEPVDLAAIISATLAAARPDIGRLGLTVQADIQPAILDGDPQMVQQLVTNLTDNAIRHNVPGGDIRIATSTSDGHAVLSVNNSGPDIPPDELDRLFQPFQRLGPRPARRDSGHGLGLSIVRAIATTHGATITAQARPGGGLAIDVEFPRQG